MLIIITGLPGSGKSTLARKLSEQLNACYLSSDLIRLEMGLQGHYKPSAKAMVYGEMKRRMELALREKKLVILDATFYLKRLREFFLHSARQITDDVYLIEMVASPNVIQERVAKPRLFSQAGVAEFQEISTIYEAPEQADLRLDSGSMSQDEMFHKVDQIIYSTAS